SLSPITEHPSMARITPIDEPSHPELAQLIGKIRGARGGRLLNLYRALLHSPPVAAGLLEFNNAGRYQTGVGGGLRELVILRVAILNGADYVLNIHKARYAAPAGVTPAQSEALAQWSSSSHFEPGEKALLAYVDAMTRDVTVPDDVFNALREHFS